MSSVGARLGSGGSGGLSRGMGTVTGATSIERIYGGWEARTLSYSGWRCLCGVISTASWSLHTHCHHRRMRDNRERRGGSDMWLHMVGPSQHTQITNCGEPDLDDTVCQDHWRTMHLTHSHMRWMTVWTIYVQKVAYSYFYNLLRHLQFPTI